MSGRRREWTKKGERNNNEKCVALCLCRPRVCLVTFRNARWPFLLAARQRSLPIGMPCPFLILPMKRNRISFGCTSKIKKFQMLVAMAFAVGPSAAIRRATLPGARRRQRTGVFPVWSWADRGWRVMRLDRALPLPNAVVRVRARADAGQPATKRGRSSLFAFTSPSASNICLLDRRAGKHRLPPDRPTDRQRRPCASVPPHSRDKENERGRQDICDLSPSLSSSPLSPSPSSSQSL